MARWMNAGWVFSWVESVLKQQNNHGFSFADVWCFKTAHIKINDSRGGECLISKMFRKRIFAFKPEQRKKERSSSNKTYKASVQDINSNKTAVFFSSFRGFERKADGREAGVVSANIDRGQCCCSCWPRWTWTSATINVCISFRMLQEICHEIVWDWLSLYFKCHHFTSQPCQAVGTVGWPVCSRMKWLLYRF